MVTRMPLAGKNCDSSSAVLWSGLERFGQRCLVALGHSPVTHGHARLPEKNPEPETKCEYALWDAVAQL
jgi:hypothetical protein